MKFQFVAAVGVVSLLGACGGSSTGNSQIDALTEEAAAALARVEPLGFTPLADIPDTGTASFSGVVAISDEDATDAADASVLGRMTMTLDLGDDSASTGSATDFYDLASTPVGGTLTLDDFVYSEGTATGSFAANLSGRLTNVGRPGTDADYDYDLNGGILLLGDDLDAVQAVMSGDVSEVGSSEDRQVTSASVLEAD